MIDSTWAVVQDFVVFVVQNFVVFVIFVVQIAFFVVQNITLACTVSARRV